jgi:hypothetical protein
MTPPPHFRPSERRLWLTELAAALDQAQQVLDRLDPNSSQSEEALHLRGRIAALWSEVDQLRRGAFSGGDTRGASETNAELAMSGYTPCGMSPPPAKGSI